MVESQCCQGTDGQTECRCSSTGDYFITCERCGTYYNVAHGHNCTPEPFAVPSFRPTTTFGLAEVFSNFVDAVNRLAAAIDKLAETVEEIESVDKNALRDTVFKAMKRELD